MNKLLSREKYEEMVSKFPVGYCQLCDPTKQIILGSSENWFWVACLSPYWRYHTMLIPKKHIEDIVEISADQFKDLQDFYLKVKIHLLNLNLKHNDGKPMDQFILMMRIREENVPGGSTYNKPKHLHIHFCPDREGVGRFILDETAVNVDIESIALEN